MCSLLVRLLRACVPTCLSPADACWGLNIGPGVLGKCPATAASQLKMSSTEWMTSKALTLVFYSCFTRQCELTLGFGR